MVAVAPKIRAASSLAATTSIATIGFAPESAAPWMQLSPTPPVPITTALSPGLTSAVFTTAPTPVITPQPRSEPVTKSTSSGRGAIWEWWTSTCSAKPPAFRPCSTGAPWASRSGARALSGTNPSQSTNAPSVQARHVPHERISVTTARSPTEMPRTPGPSARTTPATSCP